MKNTLFTYSLALGALVLVAACNNDPKKPGYDYMPDMYYSPAYEAYSVNADASASSALSMLDCPSSLESSLGLATFFV